RASSSRRFGPPRGAERASWGRALGGRAEPPACFGLPSRGGSGFRLRWKRVREEMGRARRLAIGLDLAVTVVYPGRRPSTLRPPRDAGRWIARLLCVLFALIG